MATAKSADTKGKATSGKSVTAKTAASKSSGKTATDSKTAAKTAVSKTKASDEKSALRKPESEALNHVKEDPPKIYLGNHIKFGSYYQESGSKMTPIEWVVAEIKEGELLLLSRYALDCKQYHHERVDVTWEKCDLRKWLNNDFLNLAFTSEELKKIKVSSLTNEDNPEYKTRGGNYTQDRIFCLSVAESMKYIKDIDWNTLLWCEPTKYALSHNCYLDAIKQSYWWLRSPGKRQYFASVVQPLCTKNLCTDGCHVNIDGVAVRPALRINWNR
ncbi:DUF6273 domain-containing protein [Succinimonas amylolytica]|uniref:DUF6273 domain-containing protein n=1 Tax=Succinimonas amylolytica TaxID=83769 RepID=UPI0023A8A812